MNYYGYRRRNYRTRARAYRSSRGASRYSSSSSRRAAGNYRAALQQRDQSSVNLSIPTNIQVLTKAIDVTDPFRPDGQTSVNIPYGGCTAINIFDLLRRSTFYQSYANMYDQVKIDRIRVKLTPSSFNLGGGDARYNNYTVVTAWDRSGLSDEQLVLNAQHRYDAKFGSGDSTATKAYGIYLNLSAEDISTYSSAVTKPVNAGANSSITRSLYPRTTQEKGLYINTADIDAWYEGIGENNNWYGIKNQYATQSNSVTVKDIGDVQGQVPVYGTISVVDSKAVHRNPCFIGESPTIPWKPTLLIGILNKPSIDEGAITNPQMNLYIEADIGVSFRGLRKAPVVKTISGVSLPVNAGITYDNLVVQDAAENPPPFPVNSYDSDGNLVNISNINLDNAKYIDTAAYTTPITENGDKTIEIPLPAKKLTFNVNVQAQYTQPIITNTHFGPTDAEYGQIATSNYIEVTAATSETVVANDYYQMVTIISQVNPRRYVILLDYIKATSNTLDISAPSANTHKYYCLYHYGSTAPGSSMVTFGGFIYNDQNEKALLSFQDTRQDLNITQLFLYADLALISLPS